MGRRKSESIQVLAILTTLNGSLDIEILAHRKTRNTQSTIYIVVRCGQEQTII